MENTGFNFLAQYQNQPQTVTPQSHCIDNCHLPCCSHIQMTAWNSDGHDLTQVSAHHHQAHSSLQTRVDDNYQNATLNIQQTGYFEGFDDLGKDEQKKKIDDMYRQVLNGEIEMRESEKMYQAKTGYERVDNQEVLTDGGLIRPEDRVGV